MKEPQASMNQGNTNQSDAVTGISAGETLGSSQNHRGASWLIWTMMGVLVLLALAVIFVLPKLVEQYELPFFSRVDSPANVSIPAVTSSSNQALAVSPFDEAQRARQRAQAQDILAALLAQQSELEALGVSQWAEGAYNEAIALAIRGDEAYRSQQFLLATEQYTESSDALASLLNTVPQVLTAYLQDGAEALRTGDAEGAKLSFGLALVLNPGSDEANIGLARAENLEQVISLIAQAEEATVNNQLAQARDLLEQAIKLDRYHDVAQQQLNLVRQEISDRAFTDLMSAGFLALGQGKAEPAIVEFEKALAMRPKSPQALEAIAQTRDQIATKQIAQHRDEAKRLEELERWQDAVNQYDEALAIDANLVFAARSKTYAQRRAQLDTLLQDFIKNPLRLGDQEVYEQALQVYYTGKNVENAGPVLTEQLNALEESLTLAQVPMDVQIVSDNQTEVTLYQVGVLGKLNQQMVSLKPGQYVIVGSRTGYRDVRKEFVVGFLQNPSPITVMCEEKLDTATSRQ